MAEKALSRNDLAFGRAVLLATDSFDLYPEGAFWLYDRGAKAWKYFLVSSLFDKIGARELYLRLDEAFSKALSAEEAREFSFYIGSPNEKLIQTIRNELKTTPRFASHPRMATVRINGRRIPICVYRMSEGSDETETNRVKRRFRQRTNELAYA